MMLRRQDLEERELLWILMALIKLLRMVRTKNSKTIKLPSKISTMPTMMLRMLWTRRGKKSMMLLLKEIILLTRKWNKREMKRSTILKDSCKNKMEIFKLPLMKPHTGRQRDTLLLKLKTSNGSMKCKLAGKTPKQTSQRFRPRLMLLMLNSKLRKSQRIKEILMNK
jgi:hypothetical protein